MKKLLFLGALLLSTVCMNAQTSEYYQEAANPIATNPTLWAKVTAPQISWGSTDIRYKKEEPAPIRSTQKSINLTAWKGEKVSAQMVVWTPKTLNDLTLTVSDLISGENTISKDDIRTVFVQFIKKEDDDSCKPLQYLKITWISHGMSTAAMEIVRLQRQT